MIFPFDDLDVGDDPLPRLELSLRITGDSLDPDFLTQQFGVRPTLGARKGETTGEDDEAVWHRTGIWQYDLRAFESTELGETIGLLLEVFPNDATLWEEITSVYDAQVHCGAYLTADEQTTTIDADTMRALSRLGLPLQLSLYASALRDGR